MRTGRTMPADVGFLKLSPGYFVHPTILDVVLGHVSFECLLSEEDRWFADIRGDIVELQFETFTLQEGEVESGLAGLDSNCILLVLD